MLTRNKDLAPDGASCLHLSLAQTICQSFEEKCDAIVLQSIRRNSMKSKLAEAMEPRRKGFITSLWGCGWGQCDLRSRLLNKWHAEVSASCWDFSLCLCNILTSVSTVKFYEFIWVFCWYRKKYFNGMKKYQQRGKYSNFIPTLSFDTNSWS